MFNCLVEKLKAKQRGPTCSYCSCQLFQSSLPLYFPCFKIDHRVFTAPFNERVNSKNNKEEYKVQVIINAKLIDYWRKTWKSRMIFVSSVISCCSCSYVLLLLSFCLPSFAWDPTRLQRATDMHEKRPPPGL